MDYPPQRPPDSLLPLVCEVWAISSFHLLNQPIPPFSFLFQPDFHFSLHYQHISLSAYCCLFKPCSQSVHKHLYLQPLNLRASCYQPFFCWITTKQIFPFLSSLLHGFALLFGGLTPFLFQYQSDILSYLGLCFWSRTLSKMISLLEELSVLFTWDRMEIPELHCPYSKEAISCTRWTKVRFSSQIAHSKNFTVSIQSPPSSLRLDSVGCPLL